MTQAETPVDTSGLSVQLQTGERVLQLCRRHWFFLWPSIGLQALFAIVPLIIAAWVLDKVGLDGTGANIVWLVLALHVIYRAVRAFLFWYRYRHDTWVITNQRLIDTFKAHPFNLRVSTADLVNVQDIGIERHGVLATILDYGDIICQTAGAVPAFRLTGIPDPRSVQALIDRERDRERLRR